MTEHSPKTVTKKAFSNYAIPFIRNKEIILLATIMILTFFGLLLCFSSLNLKIKAPVNKAPVKVSVFFYSQFSLLFFVHSTGK